jgi:hypothetical protein
MEKVKEQKRERTRVPLARRATAVKVDYYCAPSCSVLTARGQGNQSVQALPGRAGSFLDSVAPRQRQPKTIAAMQRAAGLVSGSCGSRQEEWRAVWEAWAAWAAWAEWAEWAAWPVEWPLPQETGCTYDWTD